MRQGRPLALVVMAAGEAGAMVSNRPKPLHRLCGRPMVMHVLDAALPLGLQRVVLVVGSSSDRVLKALQEEAALDMPVEVVTQPVARGTGDAVAVALTAFPEDELDDEADGDVLVLPGDHPLLQPSTLAALVFAHRSGDVAATMLTVMVDDPTGCMRVIRAKGDQVRRLVGDDDGKPDELEIREVATSVFCFKRSLLGAALRRINPEMGSFEGRRRAVGTHGLSDVIEVLTGAGYQVRSILAGDATETMGIDDRFGLAVAERELRRRTNRRLLAEGVTMLDPDRTYIDATARIGHDVTLYPGVLVQGKTVIGAGAEIGPGTRLIDTEVGEGAVLEYTVARGARIGAGAIVGPFAVLEPGTSVPEGVRTGPHFTA